MQHLTLVGLTEDRKKLVLVSDAGEEYTLAVDDKLRAALRGHPARSGQWERRMDSALRPRDIQARIRAGETPESVAEAAQTTVDRIMTYAGPVLAERAHIAERAQAASLRRRAGESPARVLGDAVAEHLRAENVDPDTVDWDSWRREDGRWTLVADFRIQSHHRHAVFTFDVQGRYVVAEDDESRWLVGEQAARKPSARPARAGGRRLSAVQDAPELPLGDDAIEMVTGPEEVGSEAAVHEEASPEETAHDETGPDERTVDLTTSARELRGLTPAGDADWMTSQAGDRPAPRPAPEPGRAPGAEASPRAAEPTDQEEAEKERPEPPKEPASSKKPRKGRRASVPSWDEIMFGGGRSE